ncbi:uncharacterized protein TNCV_1990661 [Trichonephila clavipes]|nr:uncharacterized protein TNCV_1990661 [Trichonephila clavipes]
MSDSEVRKWVRKFKDCRTNVLDEERSGQLFVTSNNLMQAVETKIREIRRLTIPTFSLEFPDVSQSVVYKIVTKDLNFKELSFRWVPRLLTAEPKENRFAISLDFLFLTRKKGMTF